MTQTESTVVLSAQRLGKAFPIPGGELRLFEGLDLDIHSGELLAVTGRSGAGKSTLLHILGGMQAPSEGRVLVGDEDLYRCGEKRRAAICGQRFGFVFQSHHLLPGFDAVENVLLLAAIADPDPVVFLEPKRLYRASKEPVADDGRALPLDRCSTLREGRDVTLVSWGASLVETLAAADRLADEGFGGAVLHAQQGHNGVAGYHVITPLRIEGTSLCILVNRGWIAAPRLRSELPALPAVGESRVDVIGIAHSPSGKAFELAPDRSKGRVWQHLALDRFREWSGLTLQPIILLQTDEVHDGLVRDWQPSESGALKHWGFAIVWYLAAAAAAAGGLVASMERRKPDE